MATGRSTENMTAGCLCWWQQFPKNHHHDEETTTAATKKMMTTIGKRQWKGRTTHVLSIIALSIFSIIISWDHMDPTTMMQRDTSLQQQQATTSATTTTSSTARTTSTSSQHHNITIDIVSVGSNTRFEYLQTQYDTLGSHGNVRHFVTVTEQDDSDIDCTARLTNHDAYSISDWCHEHNDVINTNTNSNSKQQQPLTWSRKYSKYFISRQALMKKVKGNGVGNGNGNANNNDSSSGGGDSAIGWLCAQRRSVTGVSKMYRLHYKNPSMYASNDDTTTTSTAVVDLLPDYLLLIDDDTYVNIDRLLKHLAYSNHTCTTSQQPYVGVGCQMIVRDRTLKKTRIFGYGGFGTIFSHGTLKLLMTTQLQCSSSSSSISRGTTMSSENNIGGEEQFVFMKEACKALSNNELGEHDYYYGNASPLPSSSQNNHQQQQQTLMDVLDRWNRHYEPFSKFKSWTKGYCYHSDWIIAILTKLYHLSSPNHANGNANANVVEPIIPHSTIHMGTGRPPIYNGQCLNSYNHCSYNNDDNDSSPSNTVVICHYQTPQQMKQQHYIYYEQEI